MNVLIRQEFACGRINAVMWNAPDDLTTQQDVGEAYGIKVVYKTYTCKQCALYKECTKKERVVH